MNDTAPDPSLFWNRIAESYASKPVSNPQAFERKIALTLAQTRPEHVLLDIGCGTGSLALRLAPHAAHVHGLDLSREMTRIARDKARAAAVNNVTFHEGAFDDSFTALGPESLDGVCAFSLLHLVSDRPAALARIFALLKPGGFFVTSTVCLGESWLPYRPLLRVMKALGKAPAVTVFDKQTFLAELQQAGFERLSLPEVGADATIAFTLANKPL